MSNDQPSTAFEENHSATQAGYQYDLVIFGATSFVGQILTTYLIEHLGTEGDISWAIAARSSSKLNLL